VGGRRRLTVQDPEFWKGLQPVAFGPLPRLQSQVCSSTYQAPPLSCLLFTPAWHSFVFNTDTTSLESVLYAYTVRMFC